MSLSIPEDAASVLEQFVHDVANTPAEITHLLEEIEDKDRQIARLKLDIAKRDEQLQKWVRINGGHVANTKEDAFSKTMNDCYDKCEILQAEKCGLSEKAQIVLERQIKRLDVGLRGLSAREEFPPDWGGPSLLSGTATGVSTPMPGTGGPLQAVSGNIGTTGGAPNIANAAQMRMAQAAGTGGRGAQQTPAANVAARSQRESSSEASKRRRLNTTIGNLPSASSNLRQSSLGPGTPKGGTPVPATISTSRAGSAQPARPTVAAKKAGAPPPGKKVAPHQAAAGSRKRVRPTNKKGDRRRQLTRDRATPSTNASLSEEEDDSASPTPSSLPRSQADGTSDRKSRNAAGPGPGDEEEEYDEENDDHLYCYCQKVSYGDMVACDNDNCRYQWFHWNCVQLKSEPKGESWLCPTCRELPKSELQNSKA
ncbi:hypothetical protein LTR08_002774 [Meristemomyces frigidus]|nr:hypothetical protein LTR08_002774 [Meristemomyces frigidus]